MELSKITDRDYCALLATYDEVSSVEMSSFKRLEDQDDFHLELTD